MGIQEMLWRKISKSFHDLLQLWKMDSYHSNINVISTQFIHRIDLAPNETGNTFVSAVSLVFFLLAEKLFFCVDLKVVIFGNPI